MNLWLEDPYLPIAACGASVLVLCFCVLFFLLLKRQIRRVRQELAPDPAVPENLKELRSEIEQLSSRLSEVEQRRSPLDWTPEPGSVNLNRRGQVLRLHRRGDSVAHIAQTLGLSQGEVELMVKLQQMAGAGPAQENISKSL